MTIRKVHRPFLSKFDFLGREVKLTFQGREKYSSFFSQIVSVLIIFTMLGLVFPVKVIEFFSSTNNSISSFEVINDSNQYNLLELGYFFAVENLSSKYGTLKVYSVDYKLDGSKDQVEIPLVPCNELEPPVQDESD